MDLYPELMLLKISVYFQPIPDTFQPLVGKRLFTFHNMCIELDPSAKPLKSSDEKPVKIEGKVSIVEMSVNVTKVGLNLLKWPFPMLFKCVMLNTYDI